MLPKYDLNKLESAMADFNVATGISISLYNTDCKPITSSGTSSGGYCRLVASVKKGRHSCARSNAALIEKCRKTKQIVRHICGAGLLDIAIPLLHRDEIVGFLMLGQIRCTEKFPEEALSFPVDEQALRSRYAETPLFDETKIESIINIATMLTKYIMFENLVRSQQKQSAVAIADFIEENLSTKLTVEVISSGVHLSPAGIYKCMRQNYSCTLGEYICDCRIKRAALLLEDANLSVEEVAEAVGFSDAAYFSRCFKKARGVSPRAYRQSLQ